MQIGAYRGICTARSSELVQGTPSRHLGCHTCTVLQFTIVPAVDFHLKVHPYDQGYRFLVAEEIVRWDILYSTNAACT